MVQDRFTIDTLDLLPRKPGIYKFYTSSGDILYVGKALNLSSRVRSYFSDTHIDRPQIIPMIPQIATIDIVETENEMEALVLEATVIKELQPPFNSIMKDDKSYAWIYISTREEVPKVSIVRSINPGEYKRGRLFGPYPSSRATRNLFRYIRKMYPFCTCDTPKKGDRCLYVHLGLCPGIYQGKITREEYLKGIGEIIKFLQGKKKRHIGSLRNQMKDYAKEREYEKAAVLRDQIYDLEHLGTQLNFTHGDTESDYVKNRGEIMKGEVRDIMSDLGTNDYLSRIECYDISNTGGEQAYGSMVVTLDGISRSNQYRIFKIKGKDSPDDYAMLRETLIRRFKHVGSNGDDSSLNSRPDAVLIDGGKGQLTAVKDVIPEGVLLLGISKGRSNRKRGMRKKDEFWVVRSGITFPITIATPRILVNLRDEAHRFALRHHRIARAKKKKISILDKIPGIGIKRKKLLLKEFGSLDGIRNATLDDVTAVLNNKVTAEVVVNYLKDNPSKV